MLPENIEINEQFAYAYDLMENTSQHIFITGKAGTGKSTLLEYFRSKTSKNIVVLAPTGVAALNVEGQTIHSFFKFKTDITYDKVKKIPRKKNLFKKLDAIIIDEISMVRADLLDCIDKSLRLNCNNSLPFGGKQMIFFGDLYQLPPVVKTNEKEIFKEKYTTPYFFSANVMKEIEIKLIELEKIYRQKDQKFIEILNGIRNRSITDEMIEMLNQRYIPDFKPDKKAFFIYLATKNEIATRINRDRLNNIKGKIYKFVAEIEGKFEKTDYPTDDVLYLKKGAQIMLLNNDKKKKWVNGSVGRITDIDEDNEIISVELMNGKNVKVKRYSWELFNYIYNKQKEKIETELIGRFNQFPIRLAWAVTVHKSQGKTFENIILDIKGGVFAPGQIYVALSRCTSLDGIVLKQRIGKKHIFVDWKIIRFLTSYKYQQAEKELSFDKKIEIIEKSIQQNKDIEITYLKRNDETSVRTIKPEYVGEMDFMGKKFVALKGYCYKRNEDRIFRIDRIISISQKE